MSPGPVHFIVYPGDRLGETGSPFACGADASEWGAVGVRHVKGCPVCVDAARKEHEEEKARRAARPKRRRVRVISQFAAFMGPPR